MDSSSQRSFQSCSNSFGHTFSILFDNITSHRSPTLRSNHPSWIWDFPWKVCPAHSHPLCCIGPGLVRGAYTRTHQFHLHISHTELAVCEHKQILHIPDLSNFSNESIVVWSSLNSSQMLTEIEKEFSPTYITVRKLHQVPTIAAAHKLAVTWNGIHLVHSTIRSVMKIDKEHTTRNCLKFLSQATSWM